MFKAGLLTEVHAPNKQQEAARELTRCRQAAQENLKRVRHQLLKFLTRHGYIYSEGNHWTGKHLKWLRSLEFEEALLHDVFDDYRKTTQTIYETSASLRLALVMGSEGKGMRRLTREACDELISIPMLGSVESLNISVATAVCLYEIRRQQDAGKY